MDSHDDARTVPFPRALMTDRPTRQQQSVRPVAAVSEVSMTTARKWCARAAAEGLAGLEKRSARPKRSLNATPTSLVARMLEMRRQRQSGAGIGGPLCATTTTVAQHLKRRGLSRLTALDPESRRAATNAKPRRPCPPGRPEAQPDRADRSPHQGRSSAQQPRCWLEVRSRRHRRRLAAWLQGGPARRARSKRHRLPRLGACLVPRFGCRGRTDHDQQRFAPLRQNVRRGMSPARA
jgi:transposase